MAVAHPPLVLTDPTGVAVFLRPHLQMFRIEPATRTTIYNGWLQMPRIFNSHSSPVRRKKKPHTLLSCRLAQCGTTLIGLEVVNIALV